MISSPHFFSAKAKDIRRINLSMHREYQLNYRVADLLRITVSLYSLWTMH